MTSEESLELWVKVAPGASRDRIDGWMGDQLKLRVTAPPQRGQANRAVCRLLAEALDVPPSQVTVTRGAGSVRKRLRVAGDRATLTRRLSALCRASVPPAPPSPPASPADQRSDRGPDRGHPAR